MFKHTGNEIFWRLYVCNDKVTIVCVQHFDLPDYDHNKWIVDIESGEPLDFETEQSALEYLNKEFDRYLIDPEYWNPSWLKKH